MILLRYFLICIIGYLLIRSIIRYGKDDRPSTGSHRTERKDNIKTKKVSKEIGEYIDYEEVKKKKN
jgi:hypothetical protein